MTLFTILLGCGRGGPLLPSATGPEFVGGCEGETTSVSLPEQQRFFDLTLVGDSGYVQSVELHATFDAWLRFEPVEEDCADWRLLGSAVGVLEGGDFDSGEAPASISLPETQDLSVPHRRLDVSAVLQDNQVETWRLRMLHVPGDPGLSRFTLTNTRGFVREGSVQVVGIDDTGVP